MPKSDLLPCPFCGKPPKEGFTEYGEYNRHTRKHSPVHYAYCVNPECGIRPGTDRLPTREEVAAVWNKRAGAPASRGGTEP